MSDARLVEHEEFGYLRSIGELEDVSFSDCTLFVSGNDFPDELANLDGFNVELEFVLANFLSIQKVLNHILQNLSGIHRVVNELHVFLGECVHVRLNEFERSHHCIQRIPQLVHHCSREVFLVQ